MNIFGRKPKPEEPQITKQKTLTYYLEVAYGPGKSFVLDWVKPFDDVISWFLDPNSPDFYEVPDYEEDNSSTDARLCLNKKQICYIRQYSRLR